MDNSKKNIYFIKQIKDKMDNSKKKELIFSFCNKHYFSSLIHNLTVTVNNFISFYYNLKSII